MGKVWIGTSGFNYKHWKNIFYPEGLAQKKWLGFYSEHFKTLEINATFYGSFKEATYKKWADTVPEDFAFAIKGPRFITHIERIKNSELSIKKFFEQASGMSEKLKVVLWQFPPSFKNDEENRRRLENFLKQLPKNIFQVFELRHKTWFGPEIYNLLDSNRMGIVISESDRFPSDNIVVGGICYIRFHGPTSLYSSSYSTEQLKKWAGKIEKWKKKADVYCYFNNDSGGHAFRNAAELDKIINRAK